MSSTRSGLVDISTEQKTYDLLRSLLDNEVEADEIRVDFSSATWARFNLTLKGSDFESSLPASVMRSLIDYQNALYRIAAYVKNDKLDGKALAADIKEGLELNFRVSGGSSEITADAIKAISEMVGKVTEGMGAKAKLVIVLSTMLTVFGVFTVPSWLEGRTEIKKEEIRVLEHKDEREHDLNVIKQLSASQAENQKVLAQAIQQQPKIAELQKQVEDARTEILRQSARADSITIQGIKIDGEVARTVTDAKRRVSLDVIIRARFKVEKAADSTSGDAFICEVRNLGNGDIIQATMLDSLMSQRDQDIVMTALSRRIHVDLEIHARRVGSSYRNAKIVYAALAPVVQRSSEK